MTERHIFHLSIPVADLASAKRFYVDARVGREQQHWLDELKAYRNVEHTVGLTD